MNISGDLVRDMNAYVLYGSKNVCIKDKIGEKLEQVDELVYLRRLFTKDGEMKGEMLQHANDTGKTVVHYN